MVREVDGFIDDGFVSGVTGLAIGGRFPTAVQVERVKKALEKVPSEIMRAILWAGQRVEVISGVNARRHPAFSNIRGAVAAGMTNEKIAAVAGDLPDLALIVLHETGHLADRVRGVFWLSYADAWMDIWAGDLAAGVVPSFADQRTEPREYFAESAAKFWDSAESRAKLSAAVRAYMAALPSRFIA